MPNDEISEKGKRERFAEWEKIGVERIKADLLNNFGDRWIGGGPAVVELAWEWVRMKEAEAKAPEVLTLKPSYMGVGVDFKELGRRVIRRLRRR